MSRCTTGLTLNLPRWGLMPLRPKWFPESVRTRQRPQTNWPTRSILGWQTKTNRSFIEKAHETRWVTNPLFRTYTTTNSHNLVAGGSQSLLPRRGGGIFIRLVVIGLTSLLELGWLKRTYYMDVNIAKNVDFYVQNRENFQCFLMSKPHQFTLFSYFYVYFMPKTKGFMPLTT